MKKYLQRIGRSLMLPVAVLPAAAILMGIGYWIDPTGWGAGSPVAAFLIKAGGSIIDHIPILFAVGVALGMAKERDGSAALSGLVAYLVVTTFFQAVPLRCYKVLTQLKSTLLLEKSKMPLLGFSQVLSLPVRIIVLAM